MSGSYIEVARVDDIQPGCMLRVEAGGQRILLANVGGTFYATDDTCTHEDASLSMGCLLGELVKCPLHGSRFNVRTGEPLEEPAEDPLRTYAVRISGKSVAVSLS